MSDELLNRCWQVHSAGYEQHGEHAGKLTIDRIYELLPLAKQVGVSAVSVIDYAVDGDGLRREAITKLRYRCGRLGLVLIPGCLMPLSHMDDRSNPAIWERAIAEIRWWRRYRKITYWGWDLEEVWGMNSQDDPATGAALQTEQQVYQSVTAIRHGMAACMREGVTPLCYGPQRVTTLNLRSKLLTDVLAEHWPAGARWVHYRTDLDPPATCGLLRMYGHWEGTGLATWQKQGGIFYGPPWSVEPQFRQALSVDKPATSTPAIS